MKRIAIAVLVFAAGCGGVAGELPDDDGGAGGGSALGGGSASGGGTATGGGMATGGGGTATGGGNATGGGSAMGGGTQDSGTDAGTQDAGTMDAGMTALTHLIGRFDLSDAAGPRFAFPGSAVAARFSGTGVGVELDDQGSNQFDVIIDGAAPTLLKTSGPVTTMLASNLAAGEHDVMLVKRTESFQGIVQFKGFMPVGGVLVATPLPSLRMMEFIGDSITCGYGVLGQLPCTFSADTEDENAAWGALAAQQLSALHAAVAYSGKGMYRNYGGDMTETMPQIWQRVFADDGTSSYGFDQYEPDVVVINLGTNDYSTGDPGLPFETAYSGFLAQVRIKYPNAFIVCATGPMADDSTYQSHVQAAIAATQDAKTSWLDLGLQDCNADGCGCDYHPSQVTQGKMAAKLVAHVKTLLPW